MKNPEQEILLRLLNRVERLGEEIAEVKQLFSDLRKKEQYQITQEWYTVQEFSQLTGLQPRTIQNRASDGLYRTGNRRSGQRIRIHYSEVIKFLEAKQEGYTLGKIPPQAGCRKARSSRMRPNSTSSKRSLTA